GKWVGDIAWYSKSQSAHVTRINLALCFPNMDSRKRERLARTSLQNWGMTIFEIPIIWRKGLKALDLINVVNGDDKVHKHIASGKGTIIVSPHLGNWELTGLWVSRLGPTTILYQPPRQAELE